MQLWQLTVALFLQSCDLCLSRPLVKSPYLRRVETFTQDPRRLRDEESFIRWETIPTTKPPPKVVFNVLKSVVPEKGAQIKCALPIYENYNNTYPVNILVGLAGPRIICPIGFLLETVGRAPVNLLVGLYRPRILSPYYVRQEANPAAELNLLTGLLNVNILNPVLLNQQLNPIAQIRVLSGLSNMNILTPQLISQTLTPSVFVSVLDGMGDGNILSPLLINMQISPLGAAYIGDGIIRPNILSPQLISLTLNPSAELNFRGGLYRPTVNSNRQINLNLSPSIVGTAKDKPLIDPQILSPSLINADPDDLVLPEGRQDPTKLRPTALLAINNSPKGLFKLPQILRDQPELYGIIKDLFEGEMRKALYQAEAFKSAMKAARIEFSQPNSPLEVTVPTPLKVQESFRLM